MSLDYAVIDVETTNIEADEVPRTKFWGFADATGYKYFRRTDDFLRFLRRDCPPRRLLHHGNFDIMQLLLDGAQLQINRSHNGRIINCSLYGHRTTNTLSAFPVALKKIFKAFGFKKTSLKDLRKRNYEDCVNGLKCFVELDNIFLRLVGVSPLQRGTIAGTSFMAAENFAGKMPKDLRFIDSYRGGRVEVFDTNKTNCSKFDINSSYPASILACPETSRLLHIEAQTGDYYCPFFDTRTDDMLLFPNGKFKSWVYEDVLEDHILPYATKTKIKILSRHTIDFSWLNALKELIQKVYDLKQTSPDPAIREVCKFFLNSFYGRIGLRGESERARVLDYPVDGDDILCEYIGRKRWLVFDKIERESRSNFPFAAYITDNARGRLYRAFVQNAALYGDTDSVFSRAGKNRFVGRIGRNCGDWKYEDRKIFNARNVKDYRFGRKTIRKGGSHGIIWTFKQYASGDPAREVWRKRRSGIRKREIQADGTTIPIQIKY